MSAKVEISATVALAESQALCDYFRQRSTIQAQAIADLKAQLAIREAEFATLAAQSAAREEPGAPPECQNDGKVPA